MAKVAAPSPLDRGNGLCRPPSEVNRQQELADDSYLRVSFPRKAPVGALWWFVLAQNELCENESGHFVGTGHRRCIGVRARLRAFPGSSAVGREGERRLCAPFAPYREALLVKQAIPTMAPVATPPLAGCSWPTERPPAKAPVSPESSTDRATSTQPVIALDDEARARLELSVAERARMHTRIEAQPALRPFEGAGRRPLPH